MGILFKSWRIMHAWRALVSVRRSLLYIYIFIYLLTYQLPEIKIDILQKKNALVSAVFFPSTC